MQERKDYDYIVIHSGTNDVGKLTANVIRTNTENCLFNLKHRWPNHDSNLRTDLRPRDNSKNQLIDEIMQLSLRKHTHRSRCDFHRQQKSNVRQLRKLNWASILRWRSPEQQNRYKETCNKHKHHLGLRGRNLESLPRNRRGFARVPVGPQREQPYNERWRGNYHNNQPLQALNQIA